MTSESYTDIELIKNLYSDQSRISDRGEFLKNSSNRRLSIRDVIRLLCKDDRKTYVLDYGCGNGSFIKSIANLNQSARCLALDIVPNEQAKNLPENIFYQIIEPFHLPKVSNSLDVIFCMNVLYHLDQVRLKEVLEWFKTNLSEAGIIYLTTKSVNNFPKFRSILETLSINYYPIPDENTFNAENCEAIVSCAFPSNNYDIKFFPLDTQIITQDYSSVIRYMASNRRFSTINIDSTIILNELKEPGLYIDSYREIIVRIAAEKTS